MAVLVNGVIIGTLWLVSHLLSKWLLLGSGCAYSATMIFSWWFVAYFTKHMNINPISLFATYVLILAYVMSAYYAGYYAFLFSNIPSVTNNLWLSFMVTAFVMVTPALFNLMVKYVSKAVAQIN